MKANELMIGDWVTTSDGNRKVEKLSKNWILEWEDGYMCTVSDIIPVQLTDSIMKINGFSIVEVGDNGPSTPPKNINRFEKWFCRTTWQDIYVWYDRLMKKWCLHGINQVHFNSVHMLQHAFRLCGIEKEIEL